MVEETEDCRDVRGGAAGATSSANLDSGRPARSHRPPMRSSRRGAAKLRRDEALIEAEFEAATRMVIEVGHVEAIFRYPVKSMGGERLEVATVGWHGLEGDRRLAFRRMNDRSGFPWLSASTLPD